MISKDELALKLRSLATRLERERPKDYEDMEASDYIEGTITMLGDLVRMASQDGCIAAAWTILTLEKLTEGEECLTQNSDSENFMLLID